MKSSTSIDQNHLLENLIQQHNEGYLPHSQLFIDVNGYGALPLALALSGTILGAESKESPSVLLDHPDLHCFYPTLSSSKNNLIEISALWKAFCLETPYGSVFDWMQNIDSGNKQGSIRVEQIVALQKQAALKPFAGKNKVFILWGIDLLLTPAANKLLKILEEPPVGTYFILICEQSEALLPTIISRCQISKLPPISSEALLLEAKKLFSKTPSDTLIKNANGSWRQLHKSLSNLEGGEQLETLWIKGLRLAFRARSNKQIVLPLFKWAQELALQNRESQKQFMLYGLELVRDALMINYQASELHRFNSFTGFDLNKFAPYIHSDNVFDLQTLLEESHYNLGRNANAKILFTHFALELSRLLNRKESGFLE